MSSFLCWRRALIERSNARLKVSLRWAVSLALLGLLACRVDPEGFFEVFHKVRPLYFLLSAILGLVTFLFASLKWWALTPDVDLLRICRLNAIGGLYSFVLPSTISGEVARIVYSNQSRIGLVRIATSTILDRLIGAESLLLLLSCCLVLDPGPLAKAHTEYFGAVIMFATVLSVPVFIPQIRMQAIYFLDRISINYHGRIKRVVHAAHEFVDTVDQLLTLKRLILSAMFACIYQLLSSLQLYLVLSFLLLPVSLGDCILVAAVVQIVSLLPLSIGGIGMKDMTIVMILGGIGITPSEGLAVSLLMYPTNFFLALVGLWFVSTNRKY